VKEDIGKWMSMLGVVSARSMASELKNGRGNVNTLTLGLKEMAFGMGWMVTCGYN
jgi:hypothetical protein